MGSLYLEQMYRQVCLGWHSVRLGWHSMHTLWLPENGRNWLSIQPKMAHSFSASNMPMQADTMPTQADSTVVCLFGLYCWFTLFTVYSYAIFDLQPALLAVARACSELILNHLCEPRLCIAWFKHVAGEYVSQYNVW